MRRELAQRHDFVAMLRGQPEAKVVAEAFPDWFG
jgi:hypothetical protein